MMHDGEEEEEGAGGEKGCGEVDYEKPLNRESETHVCAVVMETLSGLLRGYPSTLHEDRSMLSQLLGTIEGSDGSPLPSTPSPDVVPAVLSMFVPPKERRIHSMLLVMSEKEVLMQAMAAVDNYRRQWGFVDDEDENDEDE